MGFTFTQTGMAELRKGVESFEEDQRIALRKAARASAERVLVRERELLLRQTHGEGNTAAALRITEDPQKNSVTVDFGPIADRPANLPLWIEVGTIHQAARPFARPAMDAERDKIKADADAASVKAARETFAD